ncbi:hypothetical protein MH928_13665 [Flavobacterium sp. WW92]|nr:MULTISPECIES: hypothetical protein [unclassified Flavobacterium]WDO12366.1 hypothetical protein MH928_13665 [Flavobacterium sp. WW92]
MRRTALSKRCDGSRLGYDPTGSGTFQGCCPASINARQIACSRRYSP